MRSFQWLTTVPSGRAHTHNADCGNTGWHLHAVFAEEMATIADVNHFSAICGLKPKLGWGLDLFIERRCKRCVQRLQKFGYLSREAD